MKGNSIQKKFIDKNSTHGKATTDGNLVSEDFSTDETIDKTVYLFRQCHRCLKTHSGPKEKSRCPHCQKAFLPQDYFRKIHEVHIQFEDLYSEAHQLEESNIIKGLCALW